jgi:uncharacterized membrane protein
MAFVVVNSKTHTAISRRNGMICYATEAAAKAGLTRLLKTTKLPLLIVMSYDAYHAQLPSRVVKNLMSGVEVQISADMVGTCCDPSTESYWSM